METELLLNFVYFAFAKKDKIYHLIPSLEFNLYIKLMRHNKYHLLLYKFVKFREYIRFDSNLLTD